MNREPSGLNRGIPGLQSGEEVNVYISKLIYKALRKEVIRRGAHHGDQSQVVEEALRQYLGVKEGEKDDR